MEPGYRLYLIGGLRVAVDTPHDALFDVCADGAPDVVIRQVSHPPRGDRAVTARPVVSADIVFSRLEDGSRLVEWPDWFAAVVSADGTEIHLQQQGSWPQITRMVMSSVLPVALGAHDRVAFHAAAVERHGTAVVLAGESGAGKSTLAAVLCRDGGRLLSDDVTIARLDGDRVLAEPSLSASRLHGPVAAEFEAASEDPLAAKHLVRVGADQRRELPAPISRFVLLSKGDRVKGPTPLRGGQAAIEVLHHMVTELDPDPAARALKLTVATTISTQAEVVRLTWRPGVSAATKLGI